MKKIILYIISICLIISCKQTGENTKHCHYQNDIKTVASGEQYGIVTAHFHASKVAEDILNKGGNAVDAYIASQFALAVVYPRAGNIGGGGFALISQDGKVRALDYREKAPMKAHRNMYLNSKNEPIKDASTLGHLACGVPGTVAGMYELFQEYSKLKNWEELVQPSITLAREGFEVSKLEADRLNYYQKTFNEINPENKVFGVSKKWLPGDLLVQKELANTLELIAIHGRNGFYQGKNAQLIIDEMSHSGGIISLQDLNEYKAVWRKPIKIAYYDHTVCSMSPPSSGGIAIGQMLQILQSAQIHNFSRLSTAYVHLLTESMRVAYEDRAKYLGDSDFYDVPIELLLSANHLNQEMQDFSRDSARVSNINDLADIPLLKESFETTHTSIIDKDGMAVAGTTTLNSNYGSKVIIEGGGYFMNNEMDDFSVKPGVPNQFGLIGAEANAIEPQKRMLSSMTPTIVLDENNEPVIIIGTPGGSTIISSILTNLVSILNYDIPIDEAIATPRFHHQWFPDEIMYESGAFTETVKDSLELLGHHLREVNSIALVKGIQISNGKIKVSGDPRSEDHAVSQ